MYVPYSEFDACWCQPFDGPVHPHCPMHGKDKEHPNDKCETCGVVRKWHDTVTTHLFTDPLKNEASRADNNPR